MCYHKYQYIAFVAERGMEPPLTHVLPNQQFLLGLTDPSKLMSGQVSWQSLHTGSHYCPKCGHDTFLDSLKVQTRFRNPNQTQMFTDWANEYLGRADQPLERNQLLDRLNQGRPVDHEIWGDYALQVAGLEGLSAQESEELVPDSEWATPPSRTTSHSPSPQQAGSSPRTQGPNRSSPPENRRVDGEELRSQPSTSSQPRSRRRSPEGRTSPRQRRRHDQEGTVSAAIDLRSDTEPSPFDSIPDPLQENLTAEDPSPWGDDCPIIPGRGPKKGNDTSSPNYSPTEEESDDESN